MIRQSGSRFMASALLVALAAGAGACGGGDDAPGGAGAGLGGTAGAAAGGEPGSFGGFSNTAGGEGAGNADGAQSGSGGAAAGHGGGAGTAGKGGGSGICGTKASTGNADDDKCLNDNCCKPFDACAADDTCAGCLSGDTNADTCTANTLLRAFNSCAATKMCVAAAGVCGTMLTFSQGDPTVDACLTANCCDSFSTCQGDATCAGCLMGTGDDATCNASAALTSFYQCASGDLCFDRGVCKTGLDFGNDATNTCVGKCCDSFVACVKDKTCYACLAGDIKGTACTADAAYEAFNQCADDKMCFGGAGGGTGTPICGSDLSISDATVAACYNAHCCDPFGACVADVTCEGCVTGMITDAAMCSANAALGALDSCVKQNECEGGGGAGGASGNDVCGSKLSYPDADVDACVNANCCGSFTPCANDTACEACLETGGSGASCDANTLYQAFAQCTDQHACFGAQICGSSYTSQDANQAACINANCCTTFDACVGVATCAGCLTGDITEGCDSNDPFGAFGACLDAHCGAGGAAGAAGGGGAAATAGSGGSK